MPPASSGGVAVAKAVVSYDTASAIDRFSPRREPAFIGQADAVTAKVSNALPNPLG